MGSGVFGLGDFDADGLDDSLIFSSGERELHIIYGERGTGLHGAVFAASDDLTTSGLRLRLLVEPDFDYTNPTAGQLVRGGIKAVCPAGDVNGDGAADLLVSTELDYFDVPDVDEVFLIYGTPGARVTGSVDLTELEGVFETARFTLPADQDYLDEGYHPEFSSLTSGDFNGDGLSDIFFRAWPSPWRSGMEALPSAPQVAYGIYGQEGSTLTGDYDLNMLGTAGFAGFAIEHPIDPANATPSGYAPANEGWGQTNIVGDHDRDGTQDLVILERSIWVDKPEKHFLIYGIAGNQALQGTYQSSEIGVSIAAAIFTNDHAFTSATSGYAGPINAGDWNGDGLDDIALGLTWNNVSEEKAVGEVAVIFSNPETRWVGEYNIFAALDQGQLDGFQISGEGIGGSDFFGSAMASGDFNGDGRSDLLIGAEETHRNGEKPDNQGGNVYLLYGTSTPYSSPLDSKDIGSSLPGWYFVGMDWYDYVGRSVANAGDINGDGLEDFIIGAPGVNQPSDGQYSSSGQAYLIFSEPATGTFVDWKINVFGDRFALPSVDYTENGRPLLLDYALGDTWEPYFSLAEGETSLTLQRTAAHEGVILRVKMSPDLEQWDVVATFSGGAWT